MNILVEAVGSPMWGTLLPGLRKIAGRIVGMDIDPLAFGLYEMDQGYLVPRYSESHCFEQILDICRNESIQLAIPSINEGMLGWAERRESFAKEGVTVLLSPAETIALCEDKWKTYLFFVANGIPTPRTSLMHEHELIKPRVGRGGSGIHRVPPGEEANMEGCLSQEFITGQEYSVDSLCDLNGEVVYVVPRKRLVVQSGLSIKGQVVRDELIESYVRRILRCARFVGPVDIQCFREGDHVLFTEINPRIAGGLSLSMAATENWFELIGRMLRGEALAAKPVNYGLVMMRYFSDCFIHERDLLQ